MLHPVHGFVGLAHQILVGSIGSRIAHRDPDRQAERLFHAARVAAQALRRVEQRYRFGDCRFLVGLLEPQRKLVTAQARRGVAGTAAPHQQIRHHLEHRVAAPVTVNVVDLFEIVEIDIEQGAATPHALQMAEPPARLFIECSTIGKPGELIGAGQDFELLVIGDLLDGDAHMIGDPGEQGPFVLTERRILLSAGKRK